MKKVITMLLVIITFLFFSVNAFAKGTGTGINFPYADNATGVIGVLDISELPEDDKAFALQFKNNPMPSKGLISFGGAYLYLIISDVPFTTSNIKVDMVGVHARTTLSYSRLTFDLSTGKPVKHGNVYTERLTSIPDSSWSHPFATGLIYYYPLIKAGFDFSNYNHIWTPVNNSPDGSFSIEFSDNSEIPPTEDTSIWDKILDFIKDIFIPPDGFFTDWFNEIKTAFEKKLGGFGDLYNAIVSGSEDLKNSNGDSALNLKIPDNTFFQGFKGFELSMLPDVLKPMLTGVRSVLTAIVIVYTAIVIFKKVISIVNT